MTHSIIRSPSMRSTLVDVSQKCIVFVLYTACFNTSQIILTHERVISRTVLCVLAANMGASVLTANVMLFRLDRLTAGHPACGRMAVTTLAPAAFMVVALSCMRLGQTELPLLFAIGYFLGLSVGNAFLALVTAGERSIG